jgi:outer membrane protein
MRRFRLTASLTALCMALPVAAHAEDLLQVYQQARRADPVLAGADAARWAVREGVTLARAPLLPQAQAGVAYDQTHVAADNAGNNSSRAVSANLNQVLVDVSRLSQLRSAQALADAQDASYRATEQALCARVAQAYFDVLTAEDALATVMANEDAFRQQVEQSAQRFRNGLTASVDVEQARAYHARARASTGDAREALTEITGQPVGPLKTLRDDLPLLPPSPAEPQAWVDVALNQNPTLQAQQRGVAAADEDIAAARAGHLPTLNAALGVGRSAAWPLSASNTDGRNVTTVGLTLNVPLFTGGATQAQVRQALHRRDGALDELELRRRRVARETLAQYRSVLAGIGQIEATRVAVDSARKALESTRIGQGLGTQTMTDLLLAIQTLAGSQDSYSRARHQFILSRLLLQQAVGAIGETDLAAVNALLQ